MPKTAEDILLKEVKIYLNNCGMAITSLSSTPVDEAIINAMHEFSKEQVVAFMEYHSRFRMEEDRGLKKAYKEAGGIISTISYSVESVYNDFLAKKPIKSQLPINGIEYQWQYDEKDILLLSPKSEK